MTTSDKSSSGSERETVYVAGRQNGGGGKRRVHTDRQCPNLRRANSVLGRPRDAYPDEVNWCKTCAGEVDRSGPQDHSHYNALVTASEADSE